MVLCVESTVGRRRLFWATQPGACGVEATCTSDCGIPGFELETANGQGSISTDDWLRGLMINMLMTDGRMADTACGYNPNGQGGHWSESYISAGDGIGTLMRTIPPAGRVQALEAQLAAYAKQTLQKLVSRGVARSVDVVVKYVSGGNFSVNASVFGVDSRTSKVGLSAQRLDNGWIWN